MKSVYSVARPEDGLAFPSSMAMGARHRAHPQLNELPTQGICVNTAPQPETIWKGFSTTDTPFTENRHT